MQQSKLGLPRVMQYWKLIDIYTAGLSRVNRTLCYTGGGGVTAAQDVRVLGRAATAGLAQSITGNDPATAHAPRACAISGTAHWHSHIRHVTR